MNKVILMGRLTKDPEVRYLQGEQQIAIARFTLAVNRRTKSDSQQQTADFIGTVAFGRLGEFAEKYLKKGTKVVLEGHIQTGSFPNKDGQRVYTTDIVAENIEFAESKRGESNEDRTARDEAALASAGVDADGFMNIPDGIDEELPFS